MRHTDTTAQRAVQLNDGSRQFISAIATALGGTFLDGDICRWVFPDGSTIILLDDYSRARLYEVGSAEIYRTAH